MNLLAKFLRISVLKFF